LRGELGWRSRTTSHASVLYSCDAFSEHCTYSYLLQRVAPARLVVARSSKKWESAASSCQQSHRLLPQALCSASAIEGRGRRRGTSSHD
jgi:hypothetical protein